MERFVTIPVVYGSVTINQSVASVTASVLVSQRFHGARFRDSDLLDYVMVSGNACYTVPWWQIGRFRGG